VEQAPEPKWPEDDQRFKDLVLYWVRAVRDFAIDPQRPDDAMVVICIELAE